MTAQTVADDFYRGWRAHLNGEPFDPGESDHWIAGWDLVTQREDDREQHRTHRLTRILVTISASTVGSLFLLTVGLFGWLVKQGLPL